LLRFLAAPLAVGFAFVSLPAGARDPAPTAEDDAAAPERLLAKARETRTATGCREAAPTYRVVAAIGEGQEAAQHELGECLLLVAGESPTETRLFRMEAEFWLTRAAHAGNARAQRALAVHYGSGANPDAQPAEALKWALVYERNGEADIYGYKSLPATFIPGLKSDLGPGGVAAAEAFAADFAPLTLAKFTPPPREKAKDARKEPPGGPPDGAPDGRGPRRR
jgi:hypothetical protein